MIGLDVTESLSFRLSAISQLCTHVKDRLNDRLEKGEHLNEDPTAIDAMKARHGTENDVPPK